MRSLSLTLLYERENNVQYDVKGILTPVFKITYHSNMIRTNRYVRSICLQKLHEQLENCKRRLWMYRIYNVAEENL